MSDSTTDEKPTSNESDKPALADLPSAGETATESQTVFEAGRELCARLITSPHASATIASKDAASARRVDGISAVLFAEDLERGNRQVPMRPEEPLLAEDAIFFYGQPVAVVVAESPAAAAEGAEAVKVHYHPAQGIADVEHAIAMQSFLGDARSIHRGNADQALAEADFSISGELTIGSQLPFPEDPLKVRVAPLGDDGLEVWIVAELPDRIRSAIAAATGIPESRVRIHAGNLQGSPGGRQAESAWIAVLAAIASRKTRRPVSLTCPEETAAVLSAKRHGVHATFEAGFDQDGRIEAASIRFFVDGGYAAGDSDAALDQMLLHADGAYFIPEFSVSGRLCRTSKITGSALPGEGMAQGMLVMEEILTRVANRQGLPLDRVRALNFYREEGNRHSTHFGQPVEGDELNQIWRSALSSAQLEGRREQIRAWNEDNPCYKRGVAAVPLKAGISDPRADRNQGSALVQLLVDGSVSVQLGCVDAGFGLESRVAGEVARQFGLPETAVDVQCGDLGSTPHLTALLGVDCVGLMRQAVADACGQLKNRLRPVATQLLTAGGVTEIDDESVRFVGGKISSGVQSQVTVSFAEVVHTAWRRRANLSAVGSFRTPNLWWDREVGAGWPFSGFAFGAGVVEVQLDAFTGEVQVLRADIVYPGGRSAQAELDRSQVSRAVVMGLGWMLNESVDWDDQGRLLSFSPESYVIPGFGDAPLQMNVEVLPFREGPAESIAASGAESAVLLAVAAREAVREAIRSFGARQDRDVEIDLAVPATPDAVLRALREMSRQLAGAQKPKDEEKEAETK